jgi:hypothetical protein
MSLHPADLSSALRRLIRRSVCDRFGHTWNFSGDYFYCRACRISGHDAYYRRGRARGFAG